MTTTAYKVSPTDDIEFLDEPGQVYRLVPQAPPQARKITKDDTVEYLDEASQPVSGSLPPQAAQPQPVKGMDTLWTDVGQTPQYSDAPIPDQGVVRAGRPGFSLQREGSQLPQAQTLTEEILRTPSYLAERAGQAVFSPEGALATKGEDRGVAGATAAGAYEGLQRPMSMAWRSEDPQVANQILENVNAYEQERATQDAGASGFLAKTWRGTLNSGPTMILGGAAGGAPGAILFASATEMNDAIQEGQKQGLQGADLNNYVLRAGLIEAAPVTFMNAIGLPGLEGVIGNLRKAGVEKQLIDISGRGIMAALKQAGVSTLSEVPEEIITEIGHNLNAGLSGVDPSMLTKEAMFDTAVNTTAQTLMTMGLFNAPGLTQGAAQSLSGEHIAAKALNRGYATGQIDENLQPVQPPPMPTIGPDTQLTQPTEYTPQPPPPPPDLTTPDTPVGTTLSEGILPRPETLTSPQEAPPAPAAPQTEQQAPQEPEYLEQFKKKGYGVTRVQIQNPDGTSTDGWDITINGKHLLIRQTTDPFGETSPRTWLESVALDHIQSPDPAKQAAAKVAAQVTSNPNATAEQIEAARQQAQDAGIYSTGGMITFQTGGVTDVLGVMELLDPNRVTSTAFHEKAHFIRRFFLNNRENKMVERTKAFQNEDGTFNEEKFANATRDVTLYQEAVDMALEKYGTGVEKVLYKYGRQIGDFVGAITGKSFDQLVREMNSGKLIERGIQTTPEQQKAQGAWAPEKAPTVVPVEQARPLTGQEGAEQATPAQQTQVPEPVTSVQQEPEFTTLYHGGLPPNLTLEDINLSRRAQKQQKRGRNYAGFYLTDDESRGNSYTNQARQSGVVDATTYRIDIDPNANIVDIGNSIERIKEEQLQAYRDQGIDVLRGTGVQGDVQYVLLNKDVVRNFEGIKSVTESAQMPGTAPGSESLNRQIPEVTSKPVTQEVTPEQKQSLEGLDEGMLFSTATSRTPIEYVTYTAPDVDEQTTKSIVSKVIRHFRTTSDYREAGYVTPDGRMLDLSGKRMGGQPGVRAVDHREVPDLGGAERNDDMLRAIDAGLARVDFTQGMVHISRPLNPKQKAAIIRGMEQGEPDFIRVEAMDGKTHQTVYYADMEGTDTKAFSRALNEAEAVMRGERKPEKVSYEASTPDMRYSTSQTDTPEFKRWFGDSKVVDADGKPLVVYHGTDADFNVYSKSDDLGFHFGSEEQANQRLIDLGWQRKRDDKNIQVKETYLSIKKPVVLKNDPFTNTQMTYEEIADSFQEVAYLRPETIRAARSADNAMSKYEDQRETESLPEKKVFWDLLKDDLINEGYDGVVYENKFEGTGKSYVAFSPTQIKSATGNTGAFDPNNPDIRYSTLSDEDYTSAANAIANNKDAAGRPDLANPGLDEGARRLVRNADEYTYSNPEVKSDEETIKEAMSLDRKQVESKIMSGQTLTDAETYIGKRIVTEVSSKALRSGSINDIKKAVKLVNGLRRGRADVARSMRMMRDEMQTPQERFDQAVSEAFMTPSPRLKKVIDRITIRLDNTGISDSERAKLKEEYDKQMGRLALENARIRMKLIRNGIFLDQLRERLQTDNEREYAMDEAYGAIRDIHAAKNHHFTDAAYEFWISSLLSGFKTHVVNTTSNVLHTFWEFVPQRLGEAMLNTFVGSEQAAQWGEFKYMRNAVAPGLDRAFRNALRSWKTERPSFQEEISGYDPETTIGRTAEYRGAAIRGKKGRVIRIPLRALMALDEFSKSLAGQIDAAAHAYRIGKAKGLTGTELDSFIDAQVADMSSPAWEAGLNTALRVSFQTPLSEWAENKIKNPGVFRWVIPFRRTPANIFKTGLRKSPLGSISLIANWSSLDSENKVRLVAEQMIAVAFSAALAGFLLGDDDDDLPWITGSIAYNSTKKGERELERRVAPAQSIRLGGRYYSYARLEPFATTLQTLVDSANAVKESQNGKDSKKVVSDFVSKAMEAATDKTFMRGLGDLYEALQQPERSGTAYAINFGTSWVPNIIKQVARSADDVAREQGLGSGGDYFDRLKDRIAYKSVPIGQLPPKRTIWGEEMRKNAGISPATDFLYRLLSPIDDTTPAGRNELAVNLDRLIKNYNNSNPNDTFAPETPDRYIQRDGVRYDLSDDDYDRLVKEIGEGSLKALSRAHLNFESPTGRDIKKIQDVRSSVGKRVRAAIIRDLKRRPKK